MKELDKRYDAVIRSLIKWNSWYNYQSINDSCRTGEGIDVYTYDSEISCEVQGFYVREVQS